MDLVWVLNDGAVHLTKSIPCLQSSRSTKAPISVPKDHIAFRLSAKIPYHRHDIDLFDLGRTDAAQCFNGL
jgi:hypothetical protein